MEFYVQAFNLLNRTNFQSFVGNLSVGLLRHRALGGAGPADRGGDQLRVLNVEREERVSRAVGCLAVRGSRATDDRASLVHGERPDPLPSPARIAVS